MLNPTPNTLFSPSIWYDASLLSGTDGSTVSALPDQSGNGADAGGVVGTPRLKLSSVNGLNTVYFDGGNNRLFTPAFLGTNYDTSITLFVVSKLLDPVGPDLNVLFSTSDGKLYMSRCGNVSGTPYAQWDISTANLSSGGPVPHGMELYPHPADLVTVAWASYDGSTLRGRVNGLHDSAATSGNLGVTGALQLGGYDGGSFNFTGLICEVLIYPAALARWQIDRVEAYLAAKWGVALRQVIVADGNSQTFGTTLATPLAQAWPALLISLFPADDQPVTLNLGVPGQTTLDMSSDAANQVDWNISSIVPNPILVATEMINDYAHRGYTDIPDVQADWVAYCQARRAAGWKTIVVPTITPEDPARIGGLPSDWETTFRQPMLAWLVANYSAWADSLARFDLDPIMGPAPAATDASLYTDGIHPSATGHALLAPIVLAAINAALDQPIAAGPTLQAQIMAALSAQGYTPARAANLDLLTSAPFAGPNAVTLEFCDAGGTPVPAVVFTVVGVGTAVTDSSGARTLSLPSGAFTVAAIPTGGILWPDTPITVVASATFNILGTAISIPTPSSAAQTTAYLTTRDGQGNTLGDITLSFELIDPQLTTDSFNQTPFTATSNSSGLLQVALLKSAQYQARVGAGAWITFTSGSADTFALPEILGNYGP